jgi:nitrous oxidase accessory protein NosD
MIGRKAFLLFLILGISALWIGLGTAQAIDHSGTLSSDETWAPADNPHNIIGNVTVPNGITLTILPGAEIFFQGNYYLQAAGVMNANGTSENPILFTKDAGISNWSQIKFYSGGSGNLSYCVIEHATYGIYLATADVPSTIDHCTIQHCSYGIYYYHTGVNPGHVITNNTIQNNSTYAAYVYYVTDPEIGSGNVIRNNKAGLYFHDCDNPQVAAGNTISRSLDYGVKFSSLDQPVLLSGVSECGVGAFYENCSNIGTLDNLTFTDNADAAVQVENSGSFTLGSNNTIAGNGWPLAIDVGSFPDSASQIPTTGNLRNSIQIVAGTGDTTGNWPAFPNLDYILTGNATVGSSGSLTLSQGITLKGESGRYIRVNGQFYAGGASDNPIIFTRHTTDSWGGLQFYSGSQGVIQHALVEYGYYGVYQSSTANVPVWDSQFRHNTYAVYAATGANVQVRRCKFSYNDQGIYVAAGGAATIGGTTEDMNCFAGNRDYGVNNLNAISIPAENNYWGDISGPNNALNPGGKGDLVTDTVDFTPYAEVCALIYPPVIDDVSYDGCISERCTSTVSLTAHDPEGGDLTYTWEPLNGGTIIGSGQQVVFDPPDTGPHSCPYNIRATVTSSVTDLSTDEIIDIYVKLAGDTDGNGVVNVVDKVLVRNAFGQSGPPGWIDADVNCDGNVNVVDKVLVRNQFGQTACNCQ